MPTETASLKLGWTTRVAEAYIADTASDLPSDVNLSIDQAPRSILRRYAGLNRKALTRHREVCLQMVGEGGA
jgi:hypothetical protein